MTTHSQRALILYRRRRFVNHLLTYLLTYLLSYPVLLRLAICCVLRCYKAVWRVRVLMIQSA